MLKEFFTAWQFLTVLPAPSVKAGEEELGKSLCYFPVVGALLGVILAALSYLLVSLPVLPGGAMILAASVILTGGIHLDGFADTCDGLGGGKSPERILEIMRDSRIGVMGAAGIALLLLFKFSLIVSIPGHFLGRSLIMMSVLGRWAQVLACFVSPYARREGKGKAFIEYAEKKGFIAAAMITLVLCFLTRQTTGLVIFGIACVIVFLFIIFIRRKIDGMTGDTVGAVSEIAEVSALFLSLIWI